MICKVPKLASKPIGFQRSHPVTDISQSASRIWVWSFFDRLSFGGVRPPIFGFFTSVQALFGCFWPKKSMEIFFFEFCVFRRFFLSHERSRDCPTEHCPFFFVDLLLLLFFSISNIALFFFRR